MKKQYEIPYPFNVGITTNNKLVGDTNDSADWREFKIELPVGEWVITELSQLSVTIESPTPSGKL